MIFLWLGRFFIIFSMIFMLIGIIGLFRFKDFYLRILISAKIETVGLLAMLIGLIILSGVSFASLKILLIGLVLMFTNPLASHAIARSARVNGYLSPWEKIDD
ncbi:MAG: multicomponent Na+:H+ antiporter subunit [Eubacteriaceae bacterium]|jgi:multicomponent Na+:H+ antiporter subunit G|nr:multicomponent Na+:H+ antiporter subunit [Eubacteriaceae bacterium]MDK2904547.1 multicomponent Na+:H+ antiporter subunit [Eubacteriaceae bacterium]MDK2935679.1 multicomponent Na+:H+ antiporter subunit [Eubacteriaceae bacterium]MDK2962093.1 multicomponent Na+:H+ antiporter subunit [Eubacteriaceae bacterium]MDN5306831.1 multicomponent Na+:H+ antiporter subunit [Eubacteriaceae bacterium]